MKITTNYNRKNWMTLSLQLIVQLILPFCGIMFIYYTLFFPMLEVMPTVISILTEEELVVEIRDTLWNEGFNLNTILLYYIFTVAGGIVIPVIILIWSMGRLLSLGSWCAKSLKQEDPKLFWNGVPFRETRLGKWKL